jgi:hypothetical protein
MSNVSDFFDSIEVCDIPQYTKIRLGGPNDGGYVVAKELCKGRDLYSFGIGDDISFEQDFLELSPDSKVMCYDPYIDKINDYRIRHISKGIGHKHPRLSEYLPEHEFGFATFGQEPQHFIVKIDVEGAEWDALKYSIIDYMCYCDQLIVEFHILPVEYNLSHSPYFTKMYREFYDNATEQLFLNYVDILNTILLEFTSYHIHGNNSLSKIRLKEHLYPPLLEMTFINNHLIDRKYPTIEKFPTAIDQPNKTDRPDFDSLFPFKVA